MVVKVVHRNFTPELRDPESAAYRNFSQLFGSQMDKVFSGDDLREYKRVIIRQLLRGSIAVESDVVLQARATAEYEALFANLSRVVEAKIRAETARADGDPFLCQTSLLCYNGNFTSVGTRTLSFDAAEFCFRKAARGFGQFFRPEMREGRLMCASPCAPDAKSRLDCHGGQCQLQRSGARCVCPNTDTHWYWGDACESRTSKRLVFGLVGAALAALLLLAVVLAVLLGRSRRKRSQYDPCQAWQRESVPGTFQSSGVWEAEQLRDDGFGLQRGYSRFRPSLQDVDPSAQLSFQRPTVVTPAMPAP
ncbi:mucin-12-like isoform X1 [Psammomys obesus]|uniref:mucin-12-like isoform X1 n=1 Tax=Psammomys obesus TaxID=48139 RepID=UPI002452D7FA|nr:mucin-12-like isoform X1 [Psammomys obesus]